MFDTDIPDAEKPILEKIKDLFFRDEAYFYEAFVAEWQRKVHLPTLVE